MKRILVVDDEPLFLDMIQRILETEGYEVETVPDGIQAQERLELEDFDILLADFQMPMMNGAELLAHLSQLPELSRPVPFLISGKVSEDLLSQLKEGFKNIGRGFHYIQKPFRKDPFLLAIRSAFVGKRFLQHSS